MDELDKYIQKVKDMASGNEPLDKKLTTQLSKEAIPTLNIFEEEYKELYPEVFE